MLKPHNGYDVMESHVPSPKFSVGFPEMFTVFVVCSFFVSCGGGPLFRTKLNPFYGPQSLVWDALRCLSRSAGTRCSGAIHWAATRNSGRLAKPLGG